MGCCWDDGKYSGNYYLGFLCTKVGLIWSCLYLWVNAQVSLEEALKRLHHASSTATINLEGALMLRDLGTLGSQGVLVMGSPYMGPETLNLESETLNPKP